MLLKALRPLVDKFPKLASAYRRIRDAKALEQPEMTPLGFKFSGNREMESRFFEKFETELVKKIFPQVDTVINVGANIGYYVCLALHQKKHVIAFEPIELNLRYLLRNIKANDWQSRSEIYPIALSNAAGIIEIYGGGTGASLLKGWAGTPENYSTLVPCSTMNTILGDRLSGQRVFVIMDVEGAENLVLEGANNLLDMHPKPIWLVEIAGEGHLPKGEKITNSLLGTFEFFWSRNYVAITADKHMRKIERDELEQIIRNQVNTLGTCNFLFYEKGHLPIGL